MGNFLRVCIAVILIISIFTVSVFATPTGTYDLYSFDGRTIVGSSGSGNAYIGNFTRSLAYIHSLLNNISTTIDYYLPNMNNNLHYINVALVDAFSPGAGDTRSLWTLMSQAVSGITAIQSTALGIAQDVYNISTYVDGIEGSLTSIDSHIDGVESSLTSIGSKLDTANVNLKSLESINWQDTNATIQFSIDNVNYFDNLYDISDSSKILYVKLYFPVFNNSLYYLNFSPYFVYTEFFNNKLNIDFYLNANGILWTQDIEYYYDIYLNNFNLFLYPFKSYSNSQNYSIIIKISSEYNFYPYNSNSSKFFYSLPNNSTDFYIVDNFIQNHKKSEDTTLSDIKNILIDIDNNSDFIQNNNDLQINVDIDAADGQGITAIILKLQDIFDFGVGLQEFLVTLNEFNNLHWFTRLQTYEQVNYDPRDNVGYQNLYD